MTNIVPPVHTNLTPGSPYHDEFALRVAHSFSSDAVMDMANLTPFWQTPKAVYVEFRSGRSLHASRLTAQPNPYHTFGSHVGFYEALRYEPFNQPQLTVIRPGEGQGFWQKDQPLSARSHGTLAQKRQRAALASMQGVTGQQFTQQPFLHVLVPSPLERTAVDALFQPFSTAIETLGTYLAKPLIKAYNDNWQDYQGRTNPLSKGPNFQP